MTQGTALNQSARLEALLSALADQGACSIADLATAFDVSEETIRRDIRRLERDGFLRVEGDLEVPGIGHEVLPNPLQIARLKGETEGRLERPQAAIDSGCASRATSGVWAGSKSQPVGQAAKATIARRYGGTHFAFSMTWSTALGQWSVSFSPSANFPAAEATDTLIC